MFSHATLKSHERSSIFIKISPPCIHFFFFFHSGPESFTAVWNSWYSHGSTPVEKKYGCVTFFTILVKLMKLDFIEMGHQHEQSCECFRERGREKVWDASLRWWGWFCLKEQNSLDSSFSDWWTCLWALPPAGQEMNLTGVTWWCAAGLRVLATTGGTWIRLLK